MLELTLTIRCNDCDEETLESFAQIHRVPVAKLIEMLVCSQLESIFRLCNEKELLSHDIPPNFSLTLV